MKTTPTEIDHSIYIAIGLANDFNLEPTAFMEIAAFWNKKACITEAAIREIFSLARKTGLEWHNVQSLMKYIESEQQFGAAKSLGAIEIIRSSMAVAEYFHVGSLEVLRFINLFSKYNPFKVRTEFVKVFAKKTGKDLRWSEICHLIMTDEAVKQQAIKILHSNFI